MIGCYLCAQVSSLVSPPELIIIIWFFLTLKGRIMENVRNENGTCGCGRSPTGDCIGWHELTPEQYEAKTDAEKEATFGDSK